jgi:hypothetical protein
VSYIKNTYGNIKDIIRLEEIGFRIGQKIDIIRKDIVKINGTKYWFRLNNVFIVLDDDSILGE